MRLVTLTLVLSAVAVLPACGGGQPAGPEAGSSADSRVVNVYNWADYIDPALLREFEAETGIEVRYDTFDSLEMLETKLLTGNSGYDVVVPGSSFLERQVQVGVFRRIDRSLLLNYDKLDPVWMARLVTHDPGNLHGVGFAYGTTGIGYEAGKVLALMPDAPVDSWRLVLDPEVARRIAPCGIALVDAPSEVLAAVLMFLGKDPNGADESDLGAAERVLMALRPHIRYINSSTIIEDMANGNICVAVGWNSTINLARHRAQQGDLDVAIRYTIPREGTITWYDVFAIPADAPHHGRGPRFHRLPAATGRRGPQRQLRTVRHLQSRGAAADRRSAPRRPDGLRVGGGPVASRAAQGPHAGPEPPREPDLDAFPDGTVAGTGACCPPARAPIRGTARRRWRSS